MGVFHSCTDSNVGSPCVFSQGQMEQLDFQYMSFFNKNNYLMTIFKSDFVQVLKRNKKVYKIVGKCIANFSGKTETLSAGNVIFLAKRSVRRNLERLWSFCV